MGANVQPGQLVVINGLLGNAPLMREIARAAYRAGARRVEPKYIDRHFRRALIELGPEEALGQSMPWDLVMLKALRQEKGCFIQVSGDPEPQLLSDLPGDKVGKDFVWSYPNPIPEAPKIKGLLCFFNERVDAIYVDDELQPKPQTRWSQP